jgi:tripartite-type tricarboxylate transporter receptor subunit TctC
MTALRVLIGVPIAVLSLCAPALAAGWPERPIRFVVPYPPGGGGDRMARPMAQAMGKQLDQQVVVDNRGGAGGTLGADLVAKASPDGYTLLFGTVGTQAINVSLRKLPYDPVQDFSPISLTHNAPRILVVHPSVPAKTVAELISLAKAKPGQLTFASAGNGGTNHLSGELFKLLGGVQMVHVPYKGAGPAAIDVLSGRVSMTFDSIPVWASHIKAGKVRAIAVTSAQRSSSFPDLPTVSEAGLPGFEVSNWLGVFAPAKVPRPVVERLNAALKKVMADPEIRSQLVSQGVEPMYTTSQELGDLVRRDIAKWAKLVKASGAKVD